MILVCYTGASPGSGVDERGARFTPRDRAPARRWSRGTNLNVISHVAAGCYERKVSQGHEFAAAAVAAANRAEKVRLPKIALSLSPSLPLSASVSLSRPRRNFHFRETPVGSFSGLITEMFSLNGSRAMLRQERAK